jgi:hypothetical protein
MNIQLETNEAQALLNILGQLQNQSGTYPLLVKIATQVQAQEQPAAPVAAPEAPAAAAA